jgi:cinnamoyl-CoA reductase
MEEASKRRIHLVVVVLSLTIGETLQPALNLGMYLLIVTYMMGTKKAYPNAVSGFVDVQDVARAHVLVYETPTAHGRYLHWRSGPPVGVYSNDERALPTVPNHR